MDKKDRRRQKGPASLYAKDRNKKNPAAFSGRVVDEDFASEDNTPAIGQAVPNEREVQGDVDVTQSDAAVADKSHHQGNPPASGQTHSGANSPVTRGGGTK